MKHYAKELLDKYLSGRASDEEKALVESWYLQASNEGAGLTAQELEEIHEKGLRSLQAQIRHKKRRGSVWLRAAACVAVLVGLTWIYISYERGTDTTALASQEKQPSAEILPGSNKAVLTLGNGEKINLTDASNGALGQQAGITILKQSDGQLVYQYDKNLSAQTASAALNTLEVPRGGLYQLQLPDGTKVWLNAASSLQYPCRFSSTERRVRLSGEAYFEVAKKINGSRVPFIVVTENQEVEVLGTHFNVQAYPQDEQTNTTLLEGSVKISVKNTSYSSLLKPGQQAEVNPAAPARIRRVSNDDAIAWKKGYFAFENADLRVIMDNLSRWYDVNVVYRGRIPRQQFGGAFPRSAMLADLLKHLETYGNIHFKIKGRTIIVSSTKI
ncbi:DUF4974 domain-containing protein [Niabella terrae]